MSRGNQARAVFLDRDGTVSYEVGYMNHVSRINVMPESAQAIRWINQSGFRAVLVTNQSGVARGYFEESLIGRVHEELRRQLGESGARLDGVYYCPHHPREGEPPWRQECGCRKPATGMLERACRELGVQLEGSYLVGDTMVDMRTARGAGLTGILVLTGYGRGEYEHRSHLWPFKPEHIVDDLLEAARLIARLERIPGP